MIEYDVDWNDVERALNDHSPLERWAALQVIGSNAGAVPHMSPAVTGILDDEDPRVRKTACKVLKAFGPSAAAAIPRLQEIARDASDPAYSDALAALAAIARDKPDTVLPYLTQHLQHPEGWVRLHALEALAVLGKNGLPALPHAVRLLDDRWVDSNSAFGGWFSIYPAAANALAAMGPLGAEQLVARLKKEHDRAGSYLLRALAKSGPNARAALPILRPMADSLAKHLAGLESQLPVMPQYPPYWVQSLPLVKRIMKRRLNRYYDACQSIKGLHETKMRLADIQQTIAAVEGGAANQR